MAMDLPTNSDSISYVVITNVAWNRLVILIFVPRFYVCCIPIQDYVLLSFILPKQHIQSKLNFKNVSNYNIHWQKVVWLPVR